MAKVTVEAVIVWTILAVLSWLISSLFYRWGKMKLSTVVSIPLLVFYLAFVLTITIIERTPAKEMKYNLKLFWTVGAILNGRRALIAETFWNIVLFVPIGAMGAAIMRRHLWTVIIAGLLLSAGIEVTQLLTYRGLFEFDDILNNTLGTAIGAAVWMRKYR